MTDNQDMPDTGVNRPEGDYRDPNAPSEGNWKDLGFMVPAPNDEVVRFLGTENDGVTVAVGILKQLAAFNDDQWASDEAWDINSINADTLNEGGTQPVGTIVRPATRPQPRTET